MFGLGAAWYVDVFLVLGFALPALCARGIALAKRREHDRHRRWQLWLFVLFTIAIVGLEVGIRFGGVGEGIEDSPYRGKALLNGSFFAHIAVAVATYVVWLYLVVKAWRVFGVALPGSWSATHRSLGKVVLIGLWLTAASAGVVYVLGFVM